MSHEVLPRWKARLQQHIQDTTGEARDHLLAHDFPAGRSVRLGFPDGSYAHFHYAFHIVDEELREVAVFTEHCGYHYFPADELEVEVVEAVWKDDLDES